MPPKRKAPKSIASEDTRTRALAHKKAVAAEKKIASGVPSDDGEDFERATARKTLARELKEAKQEQKQAQKQAAQRARRDVESANANKAAPVKKFVDKPEVGTWEAVFLGDALQTPEGLKQIDLVYDPAADRVVLRTAFRALQAAQQQSQAAPSAGLDVDPFPYDPRPRIKDPENNNALVLRDSPRGKFLASTEKGRTLQTESDVLKDKVRARTDIIKTSNDREKATGVTHATALGEANTAVTEVETARLDAALLEVRVGDTLADSNEKTTRLALSKVFADQDDLDPSTSPAQLTLNRAKIAAETREALTANTAHAAALTALAAAEIEVQDKVAQADAAKARLEAYGPIPAGGLAALGLPTPPTLSPPGRGVAKTWPQEWLDAWVELTNGLEFGAGMSAAAERAAVSQLVDLRDALTQRMGPRQVPDIGKLDTFAESSPFIRDVLTHAKLAAPPPPPSGQAPFVAEADSKVFIAMLSPKLIPDKPKPARESAIRLRRERVRNCLNGIPAGRELFREFARIADAPGGDPDIAIKTVKFPPNVSKKDVQDLITCIAQGHPRANGGANTGAGKAGRDAAEAVERIAARSPFLVGL
jgi:hypothetical protein